MMKSLSIIKLLSVAAALPLISHAQQDSSKVAAHAKYNNVSHTHVKLFGENYRKEWAASTTLPVIKISEIKGGLTPTERGGGHQTVSLRLEDKHGKEYALRSVNKYPEVLLPVTLRKSFAASWVNDAMSAQHPYSALAVPTLSEAAGIPHSNPVIGIVVHDEKLGEYNAQFSNTVALLEERDPLGESDNTEKMLKTLDEDNDNNFDSALYFRARLLDALINDWDRHNDQWRFAYKNNPYGGKKYITVPRDRDQAFYVNQGLLPGITSLPWYIGYMQHFRKIRDINVLLYFGRDLNSRFFPQFTHEQWMQMTNQFVADENDAVLRSAVQKLPASAYNLRHDEIFNNLQSRRNSLPALMEHYYKFTSRITDLQTSDKNELVQIKDTLNNNVVVSIHKISKEGNMQQQLFYKAFDPSLTKEIRIYVHKGDDKVVFNTTNRRIKIRVIGEEGNKQYDVQQVNKKPLVYNKEDNVNITGNEADKLHKHFSNDSDNTGYVPVNLYNKTQPLVTVGYNNDDGVLFGLGIKHTQQEGFRKVPWANVQQITAAHSFSTKAFNINYYGEWNDAFGKADFLLNANIKAPNNTQNFFGAGNDTKFFREGSFRKFYRSRFDLFSTSALVRFEHKLPEPAPTPGQMPADRLFIRKGSGSSFAIGPAFQYYHLNPGDNKTRYILTTPDINNYDSATLSFDKAHIGAIARFTRDVRNDTLLPDSGMYFNVLLQGYEGLNNRSQAFAQLIPQFAIYKKLTQNGSLVLADRVGGGVTVGKPAFYQLLYLDGQNNLRGFRRYRFAGKQMVYNNLELRLKLAYVASYVLPGELGLTGFYDVGRVWIPDESSNKWHNGVGGGIYFAAARLLLVDVTVGYSTDGINPNIGLGFRF